MGRLSFSHPVTRAAFCLFLLALPLSSLWNVAVGTNHPALVMKIGPKLAGVTYDAPVDWSWISIRDGSFQKAIAARVTDAMAVRPLLIRINNEIRFALFGDLTAPSVFRGINGQLIERSYLNEYCSRVEGEGEKIAQDMVPKLMDIQNYYRSRGSIFVYVVSPSKAAHFPEYFLDRFACPSSTIARAQLVTQYVDHLKREGIHVVDTASLIHSLKGKYNIDLFPQGGVHWNELGAARAAAEIVSEIDRQAGRELVPPFTFTYTVSGVTRGVDRDLADLLNVFFPPLGYSTPKLTFQPGASCADHPAHATDAAMVGSSFGDLPARILIEDNCLSGLNFYYYLQLGRFGGIPYHEIRRNLVNADLVGLRDAKIMIVEENESFIGKSAYVDGLRAIIDRH